MSFRLFEEKHHASIYQKYGRMVPPDEVKELILQYLDKKKGPPHELAVDLGCGTGQNARLLSPHFQKVVGIDVSESQLAEARAVPGFTNITYRTGTAEQLPFPDGSVDLLTAATAAHWFDSEGFLKEASRVLKPRGCIALLGYTDQFYMHYGSCGDRLNHIYPDVKKVLLPYTSRQLAEANSKLQDLYEAIPFPDKERVENIPSKLQMSVRSAVGITESYSMYQTFQRAEPQAAAALLESVTTRLLKEMGVSSLDTMLDVTMHYYCVLACKPQ
ncbi:putative methyltransferase DDB-G0268948 [Astyanax mexicanus]|uniref:Putative methyltransferase DDB-G0268948 n=1 Tax=Astyanax mexicanus TaxID=7994 RepID=A0A8B9L1X5_ASTMX|nr:putative methyltransferase DDB-G0268948 [Astyanax mexicanus]